MKPSAEDARKLYSYSPTTGVVKFKVDHYGNKAGSRAGTAVGNSRFINLSGSRYLECKIIVLMMTNEWPDPDVLVRHVNKNRSDNRWDNLKFAARKNLSAKAMFHNKLLSIPRKRRV